MKNALISPEESVYSYDGELLGQRIAEVEQQPFEVALPLYWIECSDEVTADDWYFNAQTNLCELKPVQPVAPIEPIVETDVRPEDSLNVTETLS